MKKGRTKLVAKAMGGAMALAAVVGLGLPANVQAASNSLTVAKLETAPVMDGSVTAEEWGDVAFTVKEGEEFINIIEEGGVLPADFSADVYLGYDSTHIYIAAVANYENHKNEAMLPTDLWAGDCMQIQISDTVGTDRNELGFAYNTLNNDNQACAWTSTGNFTMEGGKDYVVKREGTTTVYEIALGIEQFTTKITEFADGMTLPFSLSFHMSDGGFLEYCSGIVQAKDINLAALIGLGAAPDESLAPAVEEAPAEEEAVVEEVVEETVEEAVEEAVEETVPVSAEPAETSGNSAGVIVAVIVAVIAIAAVAVVVVKKKKKA